MAIPILLKRSAVQGKVPTTDDLNLGEIAINTYDGKVFIKTEQSDGYYTTNSILEISGNLVKDGEGFRIQGLSTDTLGYNSVNLSINGQSSNSYSFAEGYEVVSSGGYGSHAEGAWTIAQNSSQHSEGRYNIGTATDTIHETGIGTSDTDRKNAFEIYIDGKVVAPELTTTLIDDDSTGRILTTKEWVQANAGGSVNSLNDIGDVTITNVQADDYLKWDGTAWINATPETLTIDDLSDVDTTTNLPDGYSILVWDASKNLWVPGSYVAREFDFDATSGQTDFTVTGVVFDKARVYTNGVRDRSTTFTITNNGSDTTVSFDTGKNSGDWVLIEI